MDFVQPSYFYCLIPLLFIGFVLYWLIRHQTNTLYKVGSSDLVKQLVQTVNWRGRQLRRVLWFVAMLLLIITLARPRWGSQSEYVERQGIEMMIALDISKSMLAEDLKPNRLARAKLEISELIEELAGNDIGLVLFSGAAFVQFPLTSDYTTARSFLEGANPGVISRPGTAIAEAIEIAISGFNEERATQKIIVMLTDGEDHEGEALALANEAAEKDIIIYAIGFGSPQGEPIPEYDEEGTFLGYKVDEDGQRVLTRLDEATLQDIALLTGGRYFRASADGKEVGLLSNEINKLQSSELESRFETHKIEQFQWFLGAAIIALIIWEVVPDRRRVKKGI